MCAQRKLQVTHKLRRVFPPQASSGMSQTSPCDFCHTGGASLFCGGCRHAQYCGAACQRNAWPAHKQLCKTLKKTEATATDVPGEPTGSSIEEIVKGMTQVQISAFGMVRLSGSGELGAVRILLAGGGASVNCHCSKLNLTPIAAACMKGQEAVAKFLLAQGADPTVVLMPGHQTAMTLAVHNNHAGICKLLLAHGVSANAASPSGSTALHSACYRPSGRVELVRVLLDGGADPLACANIPDHGSIDRCTALRVAKMQGHAEIVALMEAKLAASPNGGLGAAEEAAGVKSCCSFCQGDSARLLCGACHSASYCDASCQKKHWSKHKHVCKLNTENRGMKDPAYVLRKQMKATVASETGHTGARLVQACMLGRLGAVEHLILYDKADVNTDCLPTTPLASACVSGHARVVQMLLRHGANPNLVGHMRFRDPAQVDPQVAGILTSQMMLFAGMPPLHSAAGETGSAECCRLLLEHGALIDAVSPEGSTALCTATRRYGTDAVRVLLEFGADPLFVMSHPTLGALYALTPLNMAAIYGTPEQVTLMQARIAASPEMQARKMALGIDDAALSRSLGGVMMVARED